MDKKALTTIKTALRELLAKLDISAEVEITPGQEEESVLINLVSGDNALLVGYHGKNLSAIQAVLGLMVYKRTGQWYHLVVDVDNYREKRRSQVEEMARRAVDQARATGQSIAIANLGAQERRQVHLLFKDNPEVETHSEGEGRNRQLIISVK
jgi:spoIIIJ-associated protein